MNRPPTPIPSKPKKLSIAENSELEETIELDSKNEAILKSNIFIKTYIDLKSVVTEKELSPATVITVLKRAMEMVETIQELKGTEQKDFAILLVRELIDKSKLSESQKQNCLMVIDLGVLDHVVDFVVDASKGNVAINPKKIKSIVKLFKRFKKLLCCCK